MTQPAQAAPPLPASWPRLTRVLADLERDGLRSGSDHDGRQAVLELTESGRSVLAADMAERDTWLSQANRLADERRKP